MLVKEEKQMKISVVIPVFNEERTLAKVVKKLLNQPTWKLSINKKLHADTGSRRLIWLN